MTQFEALLSALRREDVSFVIIGGIAATLHGSARLTNDLDIVYERSVTNYERLTRALRPFNPYRGELHPACHSDLTQRRSKEGSTSRCAQTPVTSTC